MCYGWRSTDQNLCRFFPNAFVMYASLLSSRVEKQHGIQQQRWLRSEGWRRNLWKILGIFWQPGAHLRQSVSRHAPEALTETDGDITAIPDAPKHHALHKSSLPWLQMITENMHSSHLRQRNRRSMRSTKSFRVILSKDGVIVSDVNFSVCLGE